MTQKSIERNAAIVVTWLGGTSQNTIAQELGLSRERVRQIVNRHFRENPEMMELYHERKKYRMSEFHQDDSRWIKRPSEFAQKVKRHRKAVRREMVQRINEWKQETGRDDPTAQEIASAVGFRTPQGVSLYWLADNRRRRMAPSSGCYARGMKRLRRIAGLRAREPGHWGHLDNQKPIE